MRPPLTTSITSPETTLAGLELLLHGNPGALVLGTLLGQDETTVLVFLLQHQRFNLVAQADDVGRIGILADGQLAGGDDALALEADVHEHLVMLELDDHAINQIAFVEVGDACRQSSGSSGHPRCRKSRRLTCS